MNEEQAVFDLGKQFSMLRNRGEDLPSEKVRVGLSFVSPAELADEYDKHYPPGQPQTKRVTERKFDYELVYLGEIRMGAAVSGLIIRYGSHEWDALKITEVFFCAGAETLHTMVDTTKCNRFDVIKGWNFTFVVDKVEESLSVLRARYRIDDTTFCDETPIIGAHAQYLEGDKFCCTTHFPFVPFSKFWQVWNGYVSLRKRQINELRDTEH